MFYQFSIFSPSQSIKAKLLVSKASYQVKFLGHSGLQKEFFSPHLILFAINECIQTDNTEIFIMLYIKEKEKYFLFTDLTLLHEVYEMFIYFT